MQGRNIIILSVTDVLMKSLATLVLYAGNEISCVVKIRVGLPHLAP